MEFNELIVALDQYADRRHREPDGTPMEAMEPIKRALNLVRDMFGDTLVSEFGSIKLKTVRQRMIDEKRVRLQINAEVPEGIRMDEASVNAAICER